MVVRHNRVNMMESDFVVACLVKKWERLQSHFFFLVLAFMFSYILFLYVIAQVHGQAPPTPPGTLASARTPHG